MVCQEPRQCYILPKHENPPKSPFNKGGLCGTPLCKRGDRGDFRNETIFIVKYHVKLYLDVTMHALLCYNSSNPRNSINPINPINPIREVKIVNVYVPLRIIFTGLLFYAAYRFGKAVGKEETKELTESKKE